MQLLLGCGSNRDKKIDRHGKFEWDGLVTVDIDPAHKPDVIHDLEVLPLPFGDDTADEIHAYEVLEHTGTQGDWRFFFAQFSDFWRVLKPGGILYGSVPRWDQVWAWADPGHKRVIAAESFVFLDQRSYADVGATPMTDYRGIYKADFRRRFFRHTDVHLQFALEAIKNA